ncbi:Maf family protein [Halanaerobium hydrogeniformans]|uniref:dTTP/UTP pyrophosphatase n=1 Tax=Halanaerobium hydrogeniformans TaxID=656519 RepID=E4RMM5_HALHG|nr:Maf family protein [Halanaerobium hydrogeniformans]ADQ14556.1 maf protein [Halanaerobium hydrogeniformans]
MSEESEEKKLVLASASPRREEILKQLKLKFTIIHPKIDENNFNGDTPEELVEILAEKKSRSVSDIVENALIIAADTIVVLDGKILNKPIDNEDAKKMLHLLSNREHKVITALAVLDSDSGKIIVESNVTDVKMLELSDDDIDKYLNTGEAMDKAGSYAIQGFGGLFVESIQGSYYSVVGLPIHQLATILKKFNYGIL